MSKDRSNQHIIFHCPFCAAWWMEKSTQNAWFIIFSYFKQYRSTSKEWILYLNVRCWYLSGKNSDSNPSRTTQVSLSLSQHTHTHAFTSFVYMHKIVCIFVHACLVWMVQGNTCFKLMFFPSMCMSWPTFLKVFGVLFLLLHKALGCEEDGTCLDYEIHPFYALSSNAKTKKKLAITALTIINFLWSKKMLSFQLYPPAEYILQ